MKTMSAPETAKRISHFKVNQAYGASFLYACGGSTDICTVPEYMHLCPSVACSCGWTFHTFTSVTHPCFQLLQLFVGQVVYVTSQKRRLHTSAFNVPPVFSSKH